MLNPSKVAQHAIAAVSCLAEVYDDLEAWMSAVDIAQSRNLPKPAASKVLTALAQGQLVVGTTGPGGGYRLARKPSQISLFDVINLFGREPSLACPYGPGWCGHRTACPLHDSLAALRNSVDAYLRATSFDVFAHHRKPVDAVPAARKRRAGVSRR